MEQKLTAQIAAMYLGCDVAYPDLNGKIIRATLTGVSRCDGLETTYKRKRNNCSGDYLAFKENGAHNCNAFNCQLILTPLSEISDEDAKHILSIVYEVNYKSFGMDVPFHSVKKLNTSLRIYLNKDLKTGIEMHYLSPASIWQFGGSMSPCTGDEAVQIVDYLRSRGYDCGYGHIKSLINSGLAVKKV